MLSIEILSTLKAIKSHYKQSYDKQNLTLVVISYEYPFFRPFSSLVYRMYVSEIVPIDLICKAYTYGVPLGSKV